MLRQMKQNLRVVVCSADAPQEAEENVVAGRNRAGQLGIDAVGRAPYDPLELVCPRTKAPPRRGFFFGVQPGPADVKPCVRGREETEFAVCCRPSWSRCPACSPHRAVRGAPARCRPRSAGRLRGPDGSWLSRGWFEPCVSPFRAFVHARAGCRPGREAKPGPCHAMGNSGQMAWPFRILSPLAFLFGTIRSLNSF